MINTLRALSGLLVVTAAILTVFGYASLLTNYDTTFAVCTVVAIACLLIRIGIDQLRRRLRRRREDHEATRRLLMAGYVGDVWARRYREAGLS